jgi:nitronate monooxygenase
MSAVSSEKTTWPETRLSRLLGIRYPIIQGPFGGFRSQLLTAAVSRFGGLGSFGANSLQPDEIPALVAELRSATNAPFAMNLWVSNEDEGSRVSDRAAFERSRAVLAPYFAELGRALPEYKPYRPILFEAQARALLEASPPVFSFICGIPPADVLSECRRRGIKSLGTATTPDEAIALERAGVDAIVASGFEAGGHRGAFLRASVDSLVGTLALVPQVVDVVDLPVIAAGGIADARGVIAALALGADGVQIGTALLACEGSGASPAHRRAISSGRFTRTGLTKGFTGRLARGIENRLLATFAAPGVEILPYPLQRALVKELTTVAEPAGRDDLLQMWSGQSAGLAHQQNAVAFLQELVAAVEPLAHAVASWSQARPKRQRGSLAK